MTTRILAVCVTLSVYLVACHFLGELVLAGGTSMLATVFTGMGVLSIFIHINSAHKFIFKEKE